MNIAHLTTPTESADSKKIKGKAASHFATDVLVAPLSDRPHVTKTLKVFMVVFASIYVELMVKEPKSELFIVQSLRG